MAFLKKRSVLDGWAPKNDALLNGGVRRPQFAKCKKNSQIRRVTRVLARSSILISSPWSCLQRQLGNQYGCAVYRHLRQQVSSKSRFGIVDGEMNGNIACFLKILEFFAKSGTGHRKHFNAGRLAAVQNRDDQLDQRNIGFFDL